MQHELRQIVCNDIELWSRNYRPRVRTEYRGTLISLYGRQHRQGGRLGKIPHVPICAIDPSGVGPIADLVYIAPLRACESVFIAAAQQNKQPGSTLSGGRQLQIPTESVEGELGQEQWPAISCRHGGRSRPAQSRGR